MMAAWWRLISASLAALSVGFAALLVVFSALRASTKAFCAALRADRLQPANKEILTGRFVVGNE